MALIWRQQTSHLLNMPHQFQNSKRANITIIGSTGSIGRQTLEVIEMHPKHFKVFALACYENVELLFEQIQKFQPEIVAVYKKFAAQKLKKLCARLSHGTPSADFFIPQILSGPDSWEQICTHPKTAKVVFSSTDTTALPALLKAIKSHKQIAIANKEMIVAAGEKIMKLARRHKVTIVPIDSEHSAIFQCLQGEDPRNVEKVILTCSGGPFFGKTKSELENVTVAQALNHPTWKMGKKISVDCATLMNKGFEVIEAMHLFGLKQEQVEVIIHPESIVHAFVQFKDGSVKSQLSSPDMRLPIIYALAYPQRLKTDLPRLDFNKIQNLNFKSVDHQTFQGPRIAHAAIKKGGKAPAILTNANNRAVKAFLNGKMNLNQIYDYLKKSISTEEL